MRELNINRNDGGQRIDKFLRKSVPKLPTSLMYKYIRLKRIKLNGKRCRSDEFLKEGDVLSLYINDEFFGEQDPALPKAASEPEVVYEDENIIIVFKPPGVDVHSGSERGGENLVDIITSYLYRKGEYDPKKEVSFSPAVCNRLDRNTSGLVAAAKNSAALRAVNECIRLRRVHKRYLCICTGHLRKSIGTETAYHKKGQHNLVTVRADEAEGFRKIVTGYKVLSEKDGLMLVEVDLITGRTHQIRAHLAFLGAPVLGDGKYGNIAVNKRFGVFRQQLCAYSLRFDTKGDSVLGYLDGREFISPRTAFDCEKFGNYTNYY